MSSQDAPDEQLHKNEPLGLDQFFTGSPQSIPTIHQLDDILKRRPPGNELEGWLQESMAYIGYEIPTQEYATAMAKTILTLANDITLNADGEIIYLEVGAGRGNVSLAIKLALDKLTTDKTNYPKIRIVATDNKHFYGDEPQPPNPLLEQNGVEYNQLDYEQALNQYNPQIVLSSWMPHGEDWTKAFRHNPHVQAFFLIGDYGSTGTLASHNPDENFELEPLDNFPPQYCHQTGGTWADYPDISITELFRRIPPKLAP